jgi:hypothetical protein
VARSGALRILVDVRAAGCDEETRLVIPGRSWKDYLQLAVTEIREYGATSTQVCRRLRALLEALLRSGWPPRPFPRFRLPRVTPRGRPGPNFVA